MRTTTGLRLMALLLGTAVPLTAPAFAQDAPAETAAETAVAAGFTAEELDTLLAPIALYPDALLAQVLLATTYPVDVLKADRFLTKNPELDAKARIAMAADQDWPDPIREMTAGFPELIARMAEHIDWTEQTGGAVIAQTDDVLASLQRLRAQAKINGYLVDNEAMTVAEDPDSGSITISSANPEVVYVPQYTETVYTQPAPATPVYVTDDDDWDDILVTGAVVWGSAIILDEIFDDDDWDGDLDHWYGGYDGNGNGNSIDWDGDVNIDNGINIGNGNGNGNGIGNGGGIAGLERPTTLPGQAPDRLGEVDSNRLTNRKEGTFKPSDASRDAAREKIASAKGSKDGVATLPAVVSKRDLGKAPAGKQPSVNLPDRPKKTANTGAAAKIAPKKVSKPKDVKRPKTGAKVSTSKKAPVYLPSTGNRGNAASLRGNKSLKGNR
jgi:Protein of unknown function (DUF3300)